MQIRSVGIDLHVHADVQKAGGEETPPLVCAYGCGAEIAAPIEYINRRGLGEGDAACHHGQKDQNFDYDQSDRDGVRTARAGRGGFLGEEVGDGSLVHVSTVLALCGLRRMRFSDVDSFQHAKLPKTRAVSTRCRYPSGSLAAHVVRGAQMQRPLTIPRNWFGEGFFVFKPATLIFLIDVDVPSLLVLRCTLLIQPGTGRHLHSEFSCSQVFRALLLSILTSLAPIQSLWRQGATSLH
jgi:hypothetical protein